MKQSTRRKIFSGLTYVSFLMQTLFPYGLIGLTYAQESTVSATLESPSPITTPSTIPEATPSIIPSVAPEVTLEATPSATPEVTPEATPLASSEATPSAIPSATPEVTLEATPEAIPSDTLETSAESASLSEDKTSLRRVGDFLKETKKQEKKNYVEGEVIVKFKKEKVNVQRTSGKVRAFMFEKKFALEKTDEIKSSNIQVFKSKKSTEEMVKELKSDPSVEYVQPNYIYEPTTINTNDTYKDLLWGLDSPDDKDIDAPEAWEISEGNGTIVAVIDSGVAYNHPDLINNMWDGSACKGDDGSYWGSCNSGYDYEDNDKTPLPATSSHGTHIAGTIAAEKNNGKGVIGVAPEIKIMAIKSSLTTSEIVKGISFAEYNGASIINASWGGSTNDAVLETAIDNFSGIFVAAAGNGGFDGVGDNNESTHFYPSDYDLDNIISVAATDQSDNLASFSNYGSASVDVGAPGVDIYSTGFMNENFTKATLPGFTNTIFTKTSGGWKTGTWGDVGFIPVDNKNTQANSSYVNNDTSTLALSLPIEEIVIGEDILLNFYLYLDTEYYGDGYCYDYLAIEIDNNDDNWQGIPGVYCGSGAGEVTVDLGPATSDMRVRFVWYTDESVTGVQVPVIDDIEITNTLSYQYMNGTSMATPHVAGLVGLIWSYQPSLTTSQVKEVILSTGDLVTDLAGKTVSGKRINAYSAVLSLESPTITGLANDSTPVKSKTWNWDSTDATDTFRYLIDQTENSAPSGLYSGDKTATQPSGDGTYYLHVQAKSMAGIESAVTTVSAILDNTASAMNITSPLSATVVSGSSVVGFSNTEEVSPQCSINNLDWVSCTSGVMILSGIIGFDALPEGAFSLYVRDTDVAGNLASDTETGIIKDAVAPTGSITSPANGSTFADNPSFTASASDANGVASVKFQYKTSSSSSFIDINTDSSTPFEANWTGISLASNTTYDLQVIVEDTSGNLATFSEVSFTYDVTAPDQPVVTSPSSEVTVNGDSYSIEGTAEADSLVKIYSGPSEVDSQQLADGAITFSVSVALTQDATNGFEVSSTDEVGNESVKTVVSVITEDSTSPGIDSYTLDNPIISPQVSAGIKDTASFDLLFSESVDYFISIKNGGETPVRSWSGSDVTNPQTKEWDGKDTGGTYVSDGNYTIEVIITDKADNSITDTSKTIVVDNDPLSLGAIGNKNIDENVLLSFTASASNTEGDPVSYSLTNPPTGAIINSSDGIFNWTPTEAQGPGNYILSINSTSGDLSDSEEITITVSEVNVAPVVSDSSQSTNEDIVTTITLGATDADLPENILTYSIVSGVGHGVLDDISGNKLTYTPSADYNGPDSFTFKANDGTADSNTATVSISVNAVNDSPVAVDDTATVDEDTTLTLAKSDLISNDADVDSDPLSLISVSNPVHGGVIIDGDNVVFTPTANYNGSASFDYTISDGSLTDTATVVATVDPVNDDPVANDDSAITSEDTAVTIDLSASDIDGDSLTYSIVSGVSHGTLGTISDNQVEYTPSANYTGADSFTFKVNDDNLDSNTATISITVTEINDPPVLDSIGNKSVDELSNLTFTVTATDPDSVLTYFLAGAPTGATINSEAGVFSFTPTEAQGPGDYTLTVEVTDGIETDSEEIVITVNEVNLTPIAQDDAVSTAEDTAKLIILSATDSDIPGNTLTYLKVDDPVHGTVSLTANEATYTPNTNYNGPDSFTFKANDGTSDSNIATVTITVTAVNDAPVASNDSVSTDEDTAKVIILGTTDSDIPADTLTCSIVSNPSHGIVTLVGTEVTYTPDTNYNGQDSFSFKANDGTTDSNIATVSITVNPVNDIPVADSQSITVEEDSSKTIILSGSDIDGDSLIFSITSDPLHGSLGEISGNQVDYNPSSDYAGSDSFEFKINDGQVDSSPGLITITITPFNDPPVLDPIGNFSINEIEKLTFTANANDPEGKTPIYSLDGNPEGATINSLSGAFSWIPTESQGPGDYTFSVIVSDGVKTDSEEITVTVNEVNQAPTAEDISASTNEDTDKVISLIATDSDLPANILTYSILSDPSHGIVFLSGNEATYAPESDYNGEDSFTFKVNDGLLDSNTATVLLTISPVNDAPLAGDDITSIDEDVKLAISKSTLLVNDIDIDGDSLNLMSVDNPVNGLVSMVGDNVEFIPDANFNGVASFDYTISDGNLTSTATVNITVNPVNDIPVANDGFATTSEDGAVTVDLSASDIDDSDSLIYSIVASPTNGSLGTVTGNQVEYTPNKNYAGSDSFTFKTNDGELDSNTATISITVIEVNDPPVLDPVGDKSVDELVNLTFTATATDPDSFLTYSLTDAPAGATIARDTGIFSFTPTEAQGPRGHTFTISVTDGNSTDFEQITIIVNEVNVAPIANDDSSTTLEDTAKEITLTATDSDLPIQTLSYSIVNSPTNGSIDLTGVLVTYTPEANHNGSDSFTYKANDGDLDSNTATVSLTITPVDDAPSATNDTASVNEDETLTIAQSDLLSNDSDIDGDPIILISLSNPINGGVEIDDDNVVFTPTANYSGSASFDYTISDGNLTSTATVNITVNPVNDAPVANDGFVTINEDTPATIDLSGTDVDGNPLTYSIVSGVSHGVLGTISGNKLTYTPSVNYNGSDSFTFKVNDGTDDSNTSTIFITIVAVNDAPVASSDTDSTDEDTILTISKSVLLANDADVDGDPLNLTEVSNPVHGLVSIVGDNIVFTPTLDYFGPASFDYTVSDGHLISTTTVSIAISSVNDAPVASGTSVTVSQGGEVTIDFLGTDVDGDTLTYSIVSDVSHGVLGTISGSQLIYTPNTDYNGPDSFIYKVNDGILDSNTATISITVNPPPVISSETTNTPSETNITITWITDHPSTSRVIYDTTSRTILDVAPNYGYINSTVETDSSPKVISHSVTINGLNASTTYYYRVVSHGSPEVVGDEKIFITEGGKSSGEEVAGTSVSSSGTDSSTCSDQKPETAPVLVSVVSNEPNEATLIWKQATGPVTYYLIAFGTSSGEMLYGNPNVGGKETTSYTVRGLSAETRYYFKVRAGNNCMPGDYSNEISIRVYGESISEIPEGFSPEVLGEDTANIEKIPEEDITNIEKVLGEETVSLTPDTLPILQTKGTKNLLKVLIGFGTVFIGAGYIFLMKRKKNQ